VEVGVALTFQSEYSGLSDYQVYRGETALALLAEPLGFDSVWATEHHFSDYEMIPSPLQFLTYIAGATERVKLGTMVVVVPWHDPYRVAAEVALLDVLSNGRIILGLGRGLARSEFDRFRVPREESRVRFDEHAAAILESLETGIFELDGTYVKQMPSEIRPRPLGSFKGRSYIAGLSPETMPLCVDLGVGMVLVPNSRMVNIVEKLRSYEDLWAKQRPEEAQPAPKLAIYGYVDRDARRAEAMAHEHIGNFARASNRHYGGGNAPQTAGGDTSPQAGGKGYEHYQEYYKMLAQDEEKIVQGFVEDMAWGTPAQVIEKIAGLRDLVHMDTLMMHFSYAGLPQEDSMRSLRLFADEVLPVLHGWQK
jgi:alkanesulfonate monooxygenase SsuD/methylene tetrahydromethanopterin reductase-like flavin-dependent oxidoreductase (luciferase family)